LEVSYGDRVQVVVVQEAENTASGDVTRVLKASAI
jgi:hypothetical protein